MIGPESSVFNPYPGLRPYRADEDYLFFGREENTDALLARLRQSRFLAVVGPSGSGKSSLVLAGMIPALHAGFLAGSGSSWRIAVMRPGNDPLGNLARAMMAPGVLGDDDGHDLALEVDLARSTLERGQQGLADLVRHARLPARENVLLLVDQFEELFRYRTVMRQGAIDPARTFVERLLAAAAQDHVPIYVAMTMRSDFLGECVQFPGLAEAVNRGQYLVPRLSRQQLQLAITGPAGVGGAVLDRPLVQRLLNDVADDPDQLPILQHALMRTFEHAVTHGAEPAELTLADYAAIGRMAHALDQHAEETYGALDERHRELARRLFQCLTEGRAEGEGEGVRRPATVAEVSAVTGASQEEMRAVVEAFGARGPSFVTALVGESVDAGTVLDISHESLMRVWRRMRGWVQDEARTASQYRRLAERARLFEQGEEAPLADPALQFMLDVFEQQQPNAAWAERYGGDFGRAAAFLDLSRQARDRIEAEREVERQRELAQAKKLLEAERKGAEADRARLELAQRSGRRIRRLMVAVLALLVGVGALAIYAEDQRAQAHRKGILALVDASDQAFQANRPFEALGLAYRAAGDFRLEEFDGKQLEPGSLPDRLRSVLSQALFHVREKLHWRTCRVWPEALAVSPNGNTIAIDCAWTSDDIQFRKSDIHLWSNTGERRAILRPGQTPEGHVTALEYARDGRFLASVHDDGTLLLWDASDFAHLDDPDPIPILPPADQSRSDPPSALLDVSVSTDGRHVAGIDQMGNVQLFEVSDNLKLKRMDVEYEGDRGDRVDKASVAFGPRQDGKLLLASLHGNFVGDSQLQVWDALEGKRVFHAEQADEVGAWTGLDVWRGPPSAPSKRTPLQKWPCESEESLCIATGGGSRVRIWTEGEDAQLREERWFEPPVSVDQVRFHPDGRSLAIAGSDAQLRLWRIDGAVVLRTSTDEATADEVGPQLIDLEVLHGHSERIKGIDFAKDGTLVSTSDDLTLRVWRLPDEDPEIPDDDPDAVNVITARGHLGEVWSVAADPSGHFVASVGPDGYLLLRDREGRLRAGTRVTEQPLSDVDFSTDENGLLAAVGEGSGENCFVWPRSAWDPDAGTDLGGFSRLRADPDGASDLALHTGGSGWWLATGGFGGKVSVWAVAEGLSFRSIPPPPVEPGLGGAWGVDFAADGSSMLIAWEGSALEEHGGRWRGLAELTTAEKSAASGAIEWGKRTRFAGHTNAVYRGEISPNLHRVATASLSGKPRLWKMDGTLINTLPAENVNEMAFSPPNGAVLATVGGDRKIMLWNAEDGSYLRTLLGHLGSVNDVDFVDSDGRFLVSSSNDGTVKVWRTGDPGLGQLMTRAKRWLKEFNALEQPAE